MRNWTSVQTVFRLFEKNKQVLFFVIFGTLSCVFFFGSSYTTCNSKFIWGDEEATIVRDTSQSYFSMATDGIHGESSPEPLYYVLHKLAIEAFNKVDAGILFQHRVVSILLAALTLLLLLWSLPRFIGYVPTLLSALTLLAAPNFLYYSVEARPYMLWIFFVALLIFYSTAISESRKNGPRQFVLFLLISLGLVVSVRPGIAQVLCAIASCWVCWMLCADPAARKRAFLFSALSVPIPLIVGLFYATRNPVSKGVDAGYGLDLLNTGDLRLVKAVVDQFVSFNGNLLTSAETLLILVSLLFVIVSLFKVAFTRKSSSVARAQDRRLLLGVQAFGQLVLTVPIAVIVVFSHYYFIPRAFVFLVLYKAVFVGIGASLVLDHFKRDYPKLVRVVKWAALVSAFALIPLEIGQLNKIKFKEEVFAASAPRTEPLGLGNRIALYVKPSLNLDISTNSIRWFFEELARTEVHRVGTSLTFVTFTAEPGRDPWYSVSDEVPLDAVPLVQSGMNAVIDLPSRFQK